MNLQGISHAPLSKDAYMIAEDTLIISIKVAKNDMNNVELFYGNRVCESDQIQVTKIEMELAGADELFDFYEAIVKSDYSRICYYFKLTDKAGITVYYSEVGFSEKMERDRTEYFQFPYLRREDMIVMPEWTKDMVMYHIFPDSFADGKRHISAEGKKIVEEARNQAGFHSSSDKMDMVEYRSNLGGTINGIMENLDYIAGLGANCIYINPIFRANSYHKYDTVDYMDIDPCFGSLDDFKKLVQACHERDIKVILDGVFNHCGPDFFAFKDVLKKGEKSKYVDWFYKLQFPIVRSPRPNYETFAYVASMPKLNTGNPDVVDYCCQVGRFWIRECGIDGWRMDVANEINHEFFREFKRAIHDENPESFLIGEIWEDSTAWLQKDQFDSTMNYTFTNICKDFFAFNKITVGEFDARIQKMIHRYPIQVSLAQMNFLDTHDVGRFLSFCDNDKQKLKLAFAFMMTAPGIPSIFYGDEKGMTGISEDDYRRPMPWDKKSELEEYYIKWIKIRRNTQALSRGNYRTEYIDDLNNVYAFSRSYNGEKVLVLINAGDKLCQLHLQKEISCQPMSVEIVNIN